jgi:predicted transcriptional regulator
MKKEWNLTQKIIEGIKTVESRWYKFRIAPWNKIHLGDTIYFKDTGSCVSVKASVTKVEQHEIVDNIQAVELMSKNALADLGTTDLSNSIRDYIKDKKYAIFIHINNVEKITPFDIDKTGFGMQCAWLSVSNISAIKIKNSAKQSG